MEKMELTCVKTTDLPLLEPQSSNIEHGDSRRTGNAGSQRVWGLHVKFPSNQGKLV